MGAQLWSCVLEAAARGAGVADWESLLSSPRHPRFVMWQQLALLVIRRCWGCSYPELCDMVLCKDHTTVRDAVLRASKRLEKQEPLWEIAFEDLVQSVPERLRHVASMKEANDAFSTWKRPA